MHRRWHHRNLLARGETVTAVIDWGVRARRRRVLRSRSPQFLVQRVCRKRRESGGSRASELIHRGRVEPDVRRVLTVLVAVHQLWFVSARRPEGLDETVTKYVASWLPTGRADVRTQSLRRAVELGLGQDRLEQLDGVAGRVVDQDLLAADAGHDVVAEVRARAAERVDERGEIVDLEREAVPAAGLRHACRPASPAHRRSAARAR